MSVEFEDLRLNNEVCCPECGTKFFPGMNPDALLNLIKTVESPDVQIISNKAQ